MIVLFEDSPKCRLQQFLLNADTPYKCEFSKGTNKMVSKIRKLRKSGCSDLIVPVPDFSCNNRFTIDSYKVLLEYSKKNTGIIPIPVLCAEYYVLIHLYIIGKLPKSEFEEVVRRVSDIHEDLSFEVYCKRVLDEYTECGYLDATCCGEHTVSTVTNKADFCRRCFPVTDMSEGQLKYLNHRMVSWFNNIVHADLPLY